jgi:DeoR/GlpR family transcriptional regulator of sugar metabolism
VIVVADSSKFARRNLSLIAPLDAVHKIITDDGLAPAMVAALKARSIEVILV